MSDVIPFTPRGNQKNEEAIWICACGNRTFVLYATGALLCANCDHPVCAECLPEEGKWVGRVPPPPAPDADLEGDTLGVFRKDFDSEEFARASVMKQAGDWAKADELEMVFARNTAGASAAWFGFDTAEEKELAAVQLEGMVKHIRETVIPKYEGE